MRSLEREYDAILRRELGCRAAWLPVTSQVEIGDYGVISRGVFHKVGVLTGKDVVCISTRSADTTVSFTGSVEALRQVEGVGVHAGVDVAWNARRGRRGPRRYDLSNYGDRTLYLRGQPG